MIKMKNVQIKDILVGKDQPLTVFCGPCVIESEEHALKSAEELKKIFSKFNFNFVFKASYDKANRSSVDSFRGPGLEKGLSIFKKIKEKFDLPILTDIHSPLEAEKAATVCDMIQIPAFLCRQTDLLLAAGNTQIPVNIKKGQFLSPWEMQNALDKVLSTGNKNILLTDRGTSFGYNNLVSDMRAIVIMQQFGFPVCFDATHSVQLPGGSGTSSGGQREFVCSLAKAAIAVGANALFIEAHPDPKIAKCDSATQLSFNELPGFLKIIERLYTAVNSF